MSYTENSCSPVWFPEDDKDELSFSVSKCEGDFADCSTSDDFTLGEPTTDITIDDAVIPDQYYTYCVTATDASSNTSEFFSKASGEAASGPGTARKLRKVLPFNTPETAD